MAAWLHILRHALTSLARSDMFQERGQSNAFAIFDPKQGAKLLQGPAPTPLPQVQLTVDSSAWLA